MSIAHTMPLDEIQAGRLHALAVSAGIPPAEVLAHLVNDRWSRLFDRELRGSGKFWRIVPLSSTLVLLRIGPNVLSISKPTALSMGIYFLENSNHSDEWACQVTRGKLCIRRTGLTFEVVHERFDDVESSEGSQPTYLTQRQSEALARALITVGTSHG
jgi:hypothetical protein